jgi:hypothetical protein
MFRPSSEEISTPSTSRDLSYVLAVGEHVRQIPELAAHARGDDRALAGEEVGSRSARRHHAFFPLGIALDDHTDV